MKEYLFLMFLVLLFLSGCSKDGITPPDTTVQDGHIILKIDRNNAPQNVTTVTAYLTRSGYGTITGSLNLLSDTTADITLNEIPVGQWHLKVDAADSLGVIKYSGETDVTIIDNQTIQVTLTLIPVSTGVGHIYLYVTWGTLGNWIDYPGNPIMTGTNNGYEPFGVYQGKVLYDDNKYKMWFTGLNSGGSGVINYAESIDGLVWTRPVNSPVIFPGNYGSWDDYAVSMGAVIKEDNVYRLYYCGKASQYTGWNIGLAFSQDGINWTKHPTPVLQAGTGWESKIAPSDIVKKDNTFFLYYDGMIYDQYNSYIQYKMGVATSVDGIVFTKSNQNPILYPTSSWENPDILAGSVIYENGLFTMVYMNNSRATLSYDWAFGKATSVDGINWTKATDNPFFTAQNTANNWTYWIGFPNFRKLNGEYRIYYSAEFHNPLYLKMGLLRKQ